jgi:benzoyl-CoA-dihydrodiol lyase
MAKACVDFRTAPSRYRHWKLSIDGAVAILALDVAEDGLLSLDDLMEVEDRKFRIGRELDAEEALEIGLVTFTPDDIDWAKEVRLAIDERTTFSPDALAGMEASLRFGGPETMESKIFARLTAWQNWIFQRPNAIGEQGALKLYGTGRRPGFDRRRV